MKKLTERGTETIGKRINIPIIEEHSGNYKITGKVNNGGLYGRPSRVLLKLLQLGINRAWWDTHHIYKMLIWFGYDNDYINDIFLAKITVEYAYKDKFLKSKKKQSLEKLENEDEEYAK